MATINSVLGPIGTSELGFTLIHEQLLVGWTGWAWHDSYRFDRAQATDRSVDVLRELKVLGVSTCVDPCPMDIGRDPEFMAEASQKSSMTIIGARVLLWQA